MRLFPSFNVLAWAVQKILQLLNVGGGRSLFLSEFLSSQLLDSFEVGFQNQFPLG